MTFDELVKQIESFISTLQESDYPEISKVSALKGFCGHIAGVPELLEEIEKHV